MTSTFWFSLALWACSGAEPPSAPSEPAPATAEAEKAPESSSKTEPASLPDRMAQLPLSGGSVEVVALKNDSEEVSGRFEALRGQMDFGSGEGSPELSGWLEIDLSSYDSQLELRDQRVQDLFFVVADYPKARLELKPAAIPEGDGELSIQLEGELQVREVKVPVQGQAQMKKVGPMVELSITEPLAVSIAALEMNEPLKKLMEICAHRSIGDEVKVLASLQFGSQPEDAPKAKAKSKSSKGKAAKSG